LPRTHQHVTETGDGASTGTQHGARQARKKKETQKKERKPKTNMGKICFFADCKFIPAKLFSEPKSLNWAGQRIFTIIFTINCSKNVVSLKLR
jgi:hypothetical protein